MCINALILVIVAFCSKKLINIRTVINMIGVGYACEFFTRIYEKVLPASLLFLGKAGFMLVGVVLLSLAASLFFTSSLGAGAYDTLGFVLNERSKIPYKWCRVITDLICTGIGFAFLGPVGARTVITTFFMGLLLLSLIDRFQKKILAFNAEK